MLQFYFSEKNDVVGQDQNIQTDEQGTLEGNKSAPEPENFTGISFMQLIVSFPRQILGPFSIVSLFTVLI